MRHTDTKNDTAFRPKTQDAPIVARSTPPTNGPTAMPACTPMVTRLFAQLMSSGVSTRFGMAARDAVKNGTSASAEPNASRISIIGACANAIAAKNRVETASATIITVRRSNRSPSAPPNGPTMPATPKVMSSESACIPGECVVFQTV